MFTGIVEEVGTITAVEEAGSGVTFRIRAPLIADGLRPGDSVAVDGACLTATDVHPDGFTVDAVRTTLERTTFGGFGVGRRVNLERALALGARLGGHLVQGHVDGVGTVRRVDPQGELTLIDVAIPAEVAAASVLHGSITVNGISLTVNALPEPGVCQLSIVPFTREHTAIDDLVVGVAVNVEGDLIGKYVRRLLGAPDGPSDPAGEHLRERWGYG